MKEEILKRLDALAAKLGVASDKLWQILLAQGQIERTMTIVWVALSLAATVASGLLILRNAKRFSDASYDSGSLYLGNIIVFSVIGLISLCACMGSLSYLSGVINPEYFALRQILEVVGK
jgi:hypothetical protein